MRRDERRRHAFEFVRRVGPYVLGAGILVALRRQLPPAFRTLSEARPVALLALVFFVVWNHAATLAWRRLLRVMGVTGASVGQLVRFRLESQAVNQVVPAAGLAGEALRTVRVGGVEKLGPASVATALDNVIGAIAGLAFAALAVLVYVVARSNGSTLVPLLAGSVLALAVVVLGSRAPFRIAPRLYPRLRDGSRAKRLLEPFARRPAELGSAFRYALGLRFLERVLTVGETYVAFRATGTDVSIADAALVTGVLVVVSLAVFFLPGQIGAAEAAAASIGVFLGLPATAGLSAALVRRARQLTVCLVGVVSLWVRDRERKSERRALCEDAP